MSEPVITPCRPETLSTFIVAKDGSSITFLPCGVTSWHPEDVRHHYCARCHRMIEVDES